MKPVITIIIICLCISGKAQEREVPAKPLYWTEAGILRGNYSHWGVSLGMNYQVNKHLLTARYYNSSEALGFMLFSPKPVNVLKNIENITLSYGRVFSFRGKKLVPTAGLSIGHATWRNSNVDTVRTQGFISWTNYYYHYDAFNYVGAELGLKLIFPEGKYAGLGLDALATFQKHPYYAIGASLLIGKMR